MDDKEKVLEKNKVSQIEREHILELLEVSSHSGQYTPVDVFDSSISGNRVNYTGKYNPEEFWRLYGKVYINMFKPIDMTEDDTIPGDRLDLNAGEIVSRMDYVKPESVLEVGCGFGRCLVYVDANCKKYIRGSVPSACLAPPSPAESIVKKSASEIFNPKSHELCSPSHKA